jgi:uncharacterized coiled-coil DUF342 family protein
MDDKIKELEYQNRQYEKELKQLYPQLETALKRQRWYNQNKSIFTKSLDSEYQELVDKILNQIKLCEESIETNFININKISSEREYLLEKIEKQRKYNNEYRERVRSKKLYEKKYQQLKNTCKLFSYDKKTESMRDVLHKKFDNVVFVDSIKNFVIDTNNKHIVEL